MTLGEHIQSQVLISKGYNFQDQATKTWKHERSFDSDQAPIDNKSMCMIPQVHTYKGGNKQ